MFLQLRRQGLEVHYHRHDDGTEVDFVVQAPGGADLIQVSADVTSSDTRARELRALEAAMREHGRNEATLVTLSADEHIRLSNGAVRIVPFWRWALDLG